MASTREDAGGLRRFPEARIAAWGALLNLGWELLQAPLFADWGEPLGRMLRGCLLGTVGDVAILLGAFWATSVLFRTRGWLHGRRWAPALAFIVIGLGYTVFSEWWHTQVRHTWEYGRWMPLVFGIGLSPIAQWLVVPPLVLLLARRGGKAKAPSERG